MPLSRCLAYAVVMTMGLLLLQALVAHDAVLARGPQARSARHGHIVGQPAAFAHAFLRGGSDLIDRLPTEPANETVAVAIVGGGVAGLVAAWSLRVRGVDAVVLEQEAQPGGNARWGEDGPGRLKYPWGAHYVPIPSRRARLLRSFFETLGVLLPAAAESVQEESAELLHSDVAPGVPTCQEPTERLYYPAPASTGSMSAAGTTESPQANPTPYVGWGDGVDGLVPWERMDEQDGAQLARFRELARSEAERPTADGRPPFTLPLAECSRDAHAVALDQTPFGEWLDRRGLTSRPLRWFLEYGTRDDYGTRANATSAWAALHYFAARASEERFEWREGNGHIVRLLLERLALLGSRGDRGAGDANGQSATGGREMASAEGAVRTNALVYAIEAASESPDGRNAVRVLYAQRSGAHADDRESVGDELHGAAGVGHRDATWMRGTRLRELRARRVIYAAPLFTARRVIRGGWAESAPWLNRFSYAPWLVANLHLTDDLDRRARCDNVLYGTAGLGYTLSTHETAADRAAPLRSALRAAASFLGVARRRDGAVLTYYRALAEEPPEDARRRMLRTPWDAWRREILAELRHAHPQLPAKTRRLDVRLLGHAMTRPTPGLIWSRERAAAIAARPLGSVHFAHSDLSALPLFEEAVYWGMRVASEVALALPRKEF